MRRRTVERLHQKWEALEERNDKLFLYARTRLTLAARFDSKRGWGGSRFVPTFLELTQSRFPQKQIHRSHERLQVFNCGCPLSSCVKVK